MQRGQAHNVGTFLKIISDPTLGSGASPDHGCTGGMRYSVRSLDRSRHRQEMSGLLGCDRYGEAEVFITYGTYSN